MKFFTIAVCLIGVTVAFPQWYGSRREYETRPEPNPLRRLVGICLNANLTLESLVTEDEFDLQTALEEVCEYIRTVIEQDSDKEEDTLDEVTTQSTLRELLELAEGKREKPKHRKCPGEDNGDEDDGASDGVTDTPATFRELLDPLKKRGGNGSGEEKIKKGPNVINILLTVCKGLELADGQDEEETRAITTEDEFRTTMQFICEVVAELGNTES